MTVTLTIIRYRRRHIFFALLAMVLFRFPLWFNKRCRFWKLMGSGKGGSFSKKPDWQQWAILSASNLRFKEVQFKHLPAEVVLRKLYGSFIQWWLGFFNCQTITYLLEPLEGHGLWDGKEAFGTLPHQSEYDGTIAILTRATIRTARLKEFWQHVEGVSTKMSHADGLITSYGIGEMPLRKQATFSIWENKNVMKSFANQTAEHREVIQKTRQQNWYSEEMFVRFKINCCIGSLNGINPLKGKL